MALQNALKLWGRIRANENDEGVMLLSSKVHSDMHEDLPASYSFRLEDIVAAPLQLLTASKTHSQSTERSRWWNGTITPPLRDVKKQMQTIPVLIGSDQKSGGPSSAGAGAGADSSGNQNTPSKSKKKKKKKSKKKKAAAEAAEASGDLQSNVTESSMATQNTGTAPKATSKPPKDQRQSPSSSGEVPSIQPSISTDHSSADSVSLPHQDTSPAEPKAAAVAPTRGSITMGANNNTVVGLGRMMEEEEHHDDGWETVPAKGSEKRGNNSATKKNGAGSDNKGGGTSSGGRQQQHHHHQQQQQQQQHPQSQGRKKKNKSKAARKKEQARRLVDDIISDVLDNGKSTTQSIIFFAITFPSQPNSHQCTLPP